MASIAILVAMNLWNWRERRLAAKYLSQYKPTPLPENPSVFSGDVSIIVPTIDTEHTFTESVRLWLANNPKELIIVTIPRDVLRVEELLKPISEFDAGKIRVLVAPRANKREQLIRGIKEANGSILALVDDDTFWPHDMVLAYLLAPFEDERVGACGGPNRAYLPPYRMDPRVITPWEVAALRAFDGGDKHPAIRSVADGGQWCLVGRTILVRTSVLQNESFFAAFTGDTWFGRPLNTGDDVFVTRWVQQVCGWRIAIQDCPEAVVETTLKRDSGFALQVIRWQRSALQMLLTALFIQPGFRQLRRRYPYMAKKMTERLLRPVLNWTYLLAFVFAVVNYPIIVSPFLYWHLGGYVRSYLSFVKRYPYCRRYLWVLAYYDHYAYILDFYIWLTMSKDAWLTREVADESDVDYDNDYDYDEED